MDEQTKKEAKAEKAETEEAKILDDDELEKLVGGVSSYGNAPDGTPWIPGQNN